MKKLIIALVLFFVPVLQAHELAVATMFRNTAPYLKEWIEYHKMMGVDHFYLYNDASEDNWEEVLQPYIESGLVEVFYWPAGKPFWGAEQRLACRDGIERAAAEGTEWIAMIDSDEFLLPMQEMTVVETLRKYFTHADAIYINWFNFGTSGVYLEEGDSMLASLTECAPHRHKVNRVGKSIVRPEKVVSRRINFVHDYPMVEGAFYSDGNGEKLPMNNGRLTAGKKIRTKYIRINHYKMRDENFYQNVRKERDKSIHAEDLYDLLRRDTDFTMIEFLRSHEKDNDFWRPFL